MIFALNSDCLDSLDVCMKRLNFLTILLALVCSTGNASPINLNDFYADPSVEVNTEGTSATLRENTAFAFVLLSNDPGLGDPEIVIASPGARLSFNFEFYEDSAGDDEFGAYIIDARTGSSIGSGYEFYTQFSGSDSVFFDISDLSGLNIGLQFQLSALSNDHSLSSFVNIFNLKIDAPARTIPEPGILLLITSAALVSLFSISRSRLCQKS